MPTRRKPYKQYSEEFRREAVWMMESTGRPASEIAMELGIRLFKSYLIETALILTNSLIPKPDSSLP